MDTKQTNYYQILGIDENATLSEIKKAFRERAKKLHPDTGISESRSEPAMRELITAYQVLSNKRSRSEYDKKHKWNSKHVFNYRSFLLNRPYDMKSQAKLIFFDLLHKREHDAIERYNKLGQKENFNLELLLGVEDFMDCAFLLSEEYEKRNDFIPAFRLLLRISELEKDVNYFKHFMEEVLSRVRTIVCKKMSGKVTALEHIQALEEVLSLEIYEKEWPFFLKKLAEIYLQMGKMKEARYYFSMSLDMKPGLAGAESLRKKLAYS